MARKLTLFILVGLLGVSGCHCGESTGVGTSGVALSGSVIDQDGRPIATALVEVNGTESVTKAEGAFQLSVPAAARYILKISHPAYADLCYVSLVPLAGQKWTLVAAQVETVDAKNPITLTDSRPDLARKNIGGATFKLPPNALVDDRGNPPTGSVRAAIATLDVGNGEWLGDWAVRSDDGKDDGYLVSYGAVFVQFTDPSGKTRYQLRSGASGLLALPVVPSMRTHAASAPQARFWYYDPADGYWKHTGTATFDAGSGAYTGTITHLSTLNTDIAKFANAACLKVTLDPSIVTGLKLRIRYHSGGTPFGQAPVFVMNDTVNAAYRLPADTNVLLELLDASNAVFGNLIVEDPLGTSLVNNVVNTGPAIPAGNSLWPPSPFSDCHPVLLRLGLPQVELRINELPADVAPRDDPTDDYITWAPTFCRARLSTPMMSSVSIELTNDPPGKFPDGGDVLFAAYQNPWPVNTTAIAATLPLTLPADGSWVPFVIAGKFLKPSTDDKDAIIEAHLNNASGAVVGTKALMVRVRKNANVLKPSERSRYLFAWKNFRNQLGANYVRFQELHRLTSTVNDQGHMQPAFLPWHRAMLLDVERELQKIDPSVALHYWNWDFAAPNVFTQDFIGASPASGGFAIAEPVFAVTNPLLGWNTDLPFSSGELRRNTNDHTLAPAPGTFKPLDHPVDPDLIGQVNYGPRVIFGGGSFSDDVEERSHNPAHGWPCGGGHVRFPVRSAADPLFYLLHSQIDRQWAYWQWKNDRYGTIVAGSLTFPAPTHYDNNGRFDDPGIVAWRKGSFLEDGMWPWDGTTGGPAGRAQRPANQATPADASDPINGENVPMSRPAVPMTPFPASVHRNLWPAAAAVPQPRHMIDYLGRFIPPDGLGFCYDDVPY